MNQIVKKKALTKNKWLIEEQGNLLLVFSPLLKKYQNLIHAFTTRQGGKSPPPFDSFNIGVNHTTEEKARQDARNNRQLLCNVLNIPFDRLKTANRLVHSARVVMLETVGQPDEVDGIVTRNVSCPIYMTFADCVPIIIYDPKQHILCLVHAGWRGTADGISKQAIKFMIDNCDSNLNELVCAIGPAIGDCCYPVGIEAVEKLLLSLIGNEQLEEISKQIKNWDSGGFWKNGHGLDNKQLEDVTNKFWSLIESLNAEGLFTRGPEKIHVNLKAINACQIISSGVSQIDVTELCTACNIDLFYSYRRSFVNHEASTGRQAAIACLL